MTLFTCAISGDKCTVTYTPPIGKEGEQKSSIEIPLSPDVTGLELADIEMHSSPTKGYRMDSKFADWFSAHFGFAVVFSYIGPNTRPVLGTFSPNALNSKPSKNKSLWGSISSYIPVLGANPSEVEPTITFADCASFLVISETSLADASSRLEGEEMDVTKFRANIVVSGAEKAWEEDFWSEIVISPCPEKSDIYDENGSRDVTIKLTKNCVRCTSITIDYNTGNFGKGGSGDMLKKLMKDRRVDKGAKYSPVFGRYGYLGGSQKGGERIRIGDEVSLVKKSEDHTVYGMFYSFLSHF